MLIKDKK